MSSGSMVSHSMDWNSFDGKLLTTSALRWLEKILAERFGGNWVLSYDLSSRIILRPIFENNIAICFEGGIFPPSTSKIPCGIWSINKPWRGILHETLPTPGLSEPQSNLIEKKGNIWHFNYNLFGFMYWVLTRSEELDRADLDHFGRFSALTSHANKHEYLHRPLVDEWLHILFQLVNFIWPGSASRIDKPRISLTHDVDLPGRYAFASWKKVILRMAADVFIRVELLSALKAPLARINSSKTISLMDPHNVFSWMMDISERAGVNSTFFFITGQTNRFYDGDYQMNHPAIRDLVRKIHARGHEIGLHPSFETYCNPTALVAEALELSRVLEDEGIFQSVLGARMHYLRWKNVDTLRALVAAKIGYDATLGYADKPGFRCGTCIDYPAFDPKANQILPIRIKPLIAMEASVIEVNALNLGTSFQAYKIFINLKRSCAAVGGTFSLLWHNSSLVLPAQRELYKKVVEDI